MSGWNIPERIEPPEDDKPVIAVCEVCGGDIHGETALEYGDEYYLIDGCYIHEDCIKEWLQQFKHEG